jgi:hypothetical protein
MSSTNNPTSVNYIMPEKHQRGMKARTKWRKPLREELTTIERYNILAHKVFSKAADIELDDSQNRKTILQVVPVETEKWNAVREVIYLFVRNGRIMKIGGTRTGMKKRWGSYKCGHCVPERPMKNGQPYPGKMSVTNAHLYHTIEDDLLKGNTWEFWTWTLPTVSVTVDIMGTDTTVIAQTYHAYESRCMEMFKTESGDIPQLCDNADPNYR